MRVLPIVALLCLTGCDVDQKEGPRAAQHDYPVTMHDRTWNDPYYYLADAGHEDTQRYVEAEQQYLASFASAHESLRRTLATEINRYLLSEWEAPAVRSGQFDVYAALERGGQYPVYYRRPAGQASEPEVLLDPNELSNGGDYYALGDFATSPDNRYVAFTEDRTGFERYTLRLRDLETGDLLPLLVKGVGAGIAWHGDDIVYIDLEGRAVRQITGSGEPVRVIMTEQDPAFALSVRAGRDGRTTVITSDNPRSTEIRLLDSDGRIHLVAPRRVGHRYRVQSMRDGLAVLTNFRAGSFELAISDAANGDPNSWRFVVDAGMSPGQLIDFEVSEGRVALHYRRGIRDEIRLIELGQPGLLKVIGSGAGESLSLVTSGVPGVFRVRVRSVAEPEYFVNYDPATARLSRIVSKPVARAFERDEYEVDERWIRTSDGEEVPVLLHYRKGEPTADRPLLIEAYGAYGISQPARFRPETLPLLDRGFIIARAYIRGGGELGSAWHAAGRGANKPRSFNDFLAVTRALPGMDLGDPDKVFARGGSAGGTVVAVAMNEAPSLYRGIITRVPFVDLINTLRDPAMPLTLNDRLEWGDPDDPSMFDLLMSYSPIDNVSHQAYPDLLIQAAANDQRVGLHEPLKWLATLREKATNDPLMLIDIDENSGHLGASNQYDKRRRLTLEYAFLLTRPGIGDSTWN